MNAATVDLDELADQITAAVLAHAGEPLTAARVGQLGARLAVSPYLGPVPETTFAGKG
jgi:hypothetical protein